MFAINAEKCLLNGSNPGLSFKVNKKDRTFYVDEDEAQSSEKSMNAMPGVSQKLKLSKILTDGTLKPQ